MEFTYRSMNRHGEIKIGTLDGESRADAVLQLAERDLFVIDVRPGGKDLWTRLHEPRGFDYRITRRDVQIFLGDLGQLISSGINVEAGLRLAEDMTEKHGLRRVISSLRQDLRKGNGFAEACTKHANVFSPHIIAALRAAERTGQLEQALSRLSKSEAQILEFKEKMVSNLIYPALLLAMVILTFILVVFVVLPEFSSLFDIAGDQVPILTKVVIAMGKSVRGNSVLITMAILAAAAAVYWILHSEKTRPYIHKCLLQSERLRAWFLLPDMIRAARILGSSLSVGVKIDTALKLAADSASNEWLAKTFIDASEAVRKGNRLADYFGNSEFLPPLFVHFVRIGEETGNLGDMCLEAASHLAKSYQKRLDRLLAVLPPLVTLGLGGMIAVLVGSILLGMVSLNNAIL